MSRVEIDDPVDERIRSELDGIDWSRVTSSDAAGLGLAIGLYREHVHALKVREAVAVALWSVLAFNIVWCFLGLGMAINLNIVLGVLIFAQVVSVVWAFMRCNSLHRNLMNTERGAVDYAKSLARLYSNDGDNHVA